MNQVRQEFAKAVAQIKSASYMAQSIPQLKAEVSLLHEDLIQANKAQSSKAETEVETLHLLRAELMRFHQDRTKAQEEVQRTIQESISKVLYGGNMSETLAEIRESKTILAQGDAVLKRALEKISFCSSFAEEVLKEIRSTKTQSVDLLIDVIKEERYKQSYREDTVDSSSLMALVASPSSSIAMVSPSCATQGKIVPDLISPAGSTARKLRAGEQLEVWECKKAQANAGTPDFGGNSQTVDLENVVVNCYDSGAASIDLN
jgi:hypothetical protein